MVNVLSGPSHPFAVGVTVMVAITGAVVVFSPVNEAMSPVPEAPKPMDGVSFVQENVTPGVELIKLTGRSQFISTYCFIWNCIG